MRRSAASARWRGPGRGWRPLLTLAALAIIGALALACFGPGPRSRSGGATDVVLPPGARLPQIASTLADARVIRSRALFIAVAEASGRARTLKAGEYSFASRTSLARVLDAIARGAVVRRFVTIPEGVTSRAAWGIVMRAPDLAGTPAVPPEGSLLPETYEVRRGESRAAVLGRMRADQAALLDRLWAARRPGLPYRSPDEAVTLASVIEKETALPQERRKVAEVFVNRLARGMRLESDPTVIYALSGGDPLGHPLRLSEIRLTSPYNTYLNSGLPPGPIGNPGRASLEAALDPDPGDLLYFVADGSGGHAFSATFEEHLKNVARWRALEKENVMDKSG